ncbi:uncharacterized protein N7479_007127 [Penicillium vulpinum]|uniref:Uncharacterized protein n=1 Tax=Penicillium vulpinum TaxID=29845 RepID=A0A1V6S2X1_9EURO|nr:uncharacterized protein N7479_007127 [Penicillium vulpinum]KAJ5959977.1 hypothetical protein N7479_007127 [Penicillium vulpinum]OQE08206.1 hypothetical protein PENVUL_c010G03123 [Penicillium vulpinum]
MLPIPALQDENGRDLLSGDINSDKSSPKVAREWTSDALRAFDRVWPDPARRRQLSCFQTDSPSVFGGASNRTSISRSRQTLPPGNNHATPPSAISVDQSHQHWDTMEQAYRLSRETISRFYNPDRLKEKLLGPENYKEWAYWMKKNLEQCDGLWITNANPEIPAHSKLSTQPIQTNLNLWMTVFSNVSPFIQQELRALNVSDAQEAWKFLEKTYGRDIPMKMRSVKDLRDIMSIRYEKCASLEEYIEKMVLCSRAIQCNHGEKDCDDGGKDNGRGKSRNHLRIDGNNEWLWCQFILVNLGPKWESWVSELVGKFDDKERKNVAISTFAGLFPIIEAEHARRMQTSRYTKNCSG